MFIEALFATGCRVSEFKCSNGNCIDDVKQCDGKDDCDDDTDELNCGTYVIDST